MSTAHLQEAQSLSPDALVELFTLDTSMLSNIYGTPGTGSVYHWCPGSMSNAPISFAGITYTPMPIEGTGWEWNGQGKLPQPKLKITNTNGLATGLIVQYGDMLGATVTRLRTFAKFLDGQPTADPSAVFSPDIFRIDRKSQHNKAFVEFELAAAIDQMGIKLPRLQVLVDACTFTYRVYRNGAFVPGTCPYAGGPMFDAGDQAVGDPTKDVCSHRLTGCVARYGSATPLPFGAFPGCAQVVV